MPTSHIQLIVGLGNPGAQYENTRHNAGFWFVEALAKIHQAQFRAEKHFQALMAQFSLTNHDKIVLLMPETFMNLSGQSVGLAARYFQIPPQNILVVHDELDLPVGAARLKLGGGHAGHNGLKDIINKLQSKDFWRLRLGIARPLHPGHAVVDYVLAKPPVVERKQIDHSIDAALAICDDLYAGAFDKAMTKLHTGN